MFFADELLDGGVNAMQARPTHVYLCSQEPATYAEATATYAKGNKAITMGAVGNGTPNGRATTMPGFLDGTVTSAGSATHYAFVHAGSSTLLVAAELVDPVTLTMGVPFPLAAITLRTPDAVIDA